MCGPPQLKEFWKCKPMYFQIQLTGKCNDVTPRQTEHRRLQEGMMNIKSLETVQEAFQNDGCLESQSLPQTVWFCFPQATAPQLPHDQIRIQP